MLPGDLFTGTNTWAEDQIGEEVEEEGEEEDEEEEEGLDPGVMTRW